MTLLPDGSALSPADLSRLKERAYESEQFLVSLKAELEELTAHFKERRDNDLTIRLRHENAVLRHQVDEQKKLLLKVEADHKVPQVPRPPFPRAPGTSFSTAAAAPPSPPTAATTEAVEKTEKNADKPAKKEKKEQPKKSVSEASSAVVKEDTPVDVSRLDLRVGRIISAKKHPDADALYVEDVDVGEAQPRTVVSGLVRFVPLDQMQNRMAVLLCNLKPAKMRGITSQAMVMCASTPDKVEILDPPAGSQPGDEIHVEGFPRKPDAVLNPKHKVFENVAPDLKTDANRVATYKGVALTVPGKGNITAPSLTGVQIK